MIRILLRQFTNIFTGLLAVAATVSYGIGDHTEAALILFFIALNGVVGFIQEYHSDHALRLLATFIEPIAHVRRDGHELVVPTSALVVNDELVIRHGDRIGADVAWTETNALMIDESTLTGESAPVTKQEHEQGFAGTVCVGGMGVGRVTAVGKQTRFGSIETLTTTTARASAFDQEMKLLGTLILKISLALVGAVFLGNLVFNRSLELPQLAIFCIALAVGMIPEALPIVTTISLSRGALRMAKKHVAVRRLSAIEDLGSIDVLCTDKTGTLTQNVLRVAGFHGPDKTTALIAGALGTSDPDVRTHQTNNAFDLAVIDALDHESRMLPKHTRLHEIVFDPTRRRNSVLVRTEKDQTLIVRGAPEAIVAICRNVSPTDKRDLTAWIAAEGAAGRRTMSVAMTPFAHDTYATHDEQNLEYLGTISFEDPLKETASKAIEHARALGVQIKILTGDGPEVTRHVATTVGLIPTNGTIITGDAWATLNATQRTDAARDTHVFARLTPVQKFEIIQTIKATQSVGFMGEGINDAPALKIAHVGMVVKEASDIAREASDVLLLDASLDVIVHGIREGRAVFANTVKYIRTMLASNFGNSITIAVSSVFMKELPMLPVQILLTNILSDLPMVAISTDAVDGHDLKRPMHYNIHSFLRTTTWLGLVSTAFDGIFLTLFFPLGYVVLRSAWFIESLFTELVLVFSIRTHGPFWKTKKPSSILLTLAGGTALSAIALTTVPTLARTLHFTELSISQSFLTLGIVGAYFLISEIVKLHLFRNEHNG